MARKAAPPIPLSIQYANKALASFFNATNPLKSYANQTWKLRQENGSEVTYENKGEYVIWPFPIRKELYEVMQNISLYFSFSISMNNDEINEVNIKVFKEDITKQKVNGYLQTELLLRAEWSNLPTADNIADRHAHPHWHVHSYKVVDLMKHLPFGKQKTVMELLSEEGTSLISDTLEKNTEIAAKLEVPENSIQVAGSALKTEAKEIPSFKFHLAMLAEWDKSKEVNDKKVLTAETLKIWLPKCLRYIQDQLEYVIEKM